MTQAPGRKFLLVTGILYVIFGGIAIFTSASGIASASFWDLVLPTASGMSWNLYYSFTLIAALFQLLIGIMGIINRDKLEKASLLRIFGFADIGFVVVAAIMGMLIFSGALGGATAFFSLGVGVVLPILYIIGAQKNLAAQ